MRIVILDGFTANPGDLDWSAFEKLGHLEVFDRTAPEAVASRAAKADALFTNKAILDAATIAALPKLRFIGVLATGYNVVDTAAAAARGIPVCNVPAYGTENVAQAVFALLLELTNRTGHHAEAVRAGRWSTCADWCFWDFPLLELHGRTLGLVGCGRIGAAVARLATAFGMRVLAHRRGGAVPDGCAEAASLDTVFRESDIVSLHCPLTEETRHLVDARRLAQMRPGALLINTARGPLIDEHALAEALNSGAIGGAGLDVLSIEPPPADHPLLRARNCIITPHIAWATRAARARLLDIAASNLAAWLSGAPRNVVNGV